MQVGRLRPTEAQIMPRPKVSKIGPMTRREQRFAYRMLSPTILIVAAIVLLPLVATFWISFKSVELSDLRPAEATVRERLRGDLVAAGDAAELQYTLRNTSPNQPVLNVALTDTLPAGLTVASVDPNCTVDGAAIACALDAIEEGGRVVLALGVVAGEAYVADPADPRDSEPVIASTSQNALISGDWTFENFSRVFDAREFWDVLWVTFAYTFFGTAGALVLGLFAAQLLDKAFAGRSILRGLFLFPYVAPVIAMAFTWLILLDPTKGSVNKLLMQMGAIDEPINFFGVRYVDVSILGIEFGFPMALSMVIAFEAWRYFPLSFLFILARKQSIPTDMYEAADMDGASPLQQFWELSLPQLFGILSVLFLLRFIWTFNKFDDIFLLTGGGSGTRTLTVDVYEKGFALNNLGAGAAVAVVVFIILFTLAMLYFRSMPKEEGL